MKLKKISVLLITLLFLTSMLGFSISAHSQETLTLATMADQYVEAFEHLIPQYEEETGVKIEMDVLGYGELKQKLTADFVGGTGQYDLMTVDIVWVGEFAENNYTVDLNKFLEEDKDEVNPDDIMPVMWSLGEWKGELAAFPLSGYANVLAYNMEMFEEAGIDEPKTMEEFKNAAKALTKPEEDQYGIALLGARGSAIAQDFMSYAMHFGGKIINDEGEVVIDSEENLEALKFYKKLYEYAPPGVNDYWWNERETAFRNGLVAMQECWNISRQDYEDSSMSNVVGKAKITNPPVKEGLESTYGFGGWGIGINKDSENIEQAWHFIKWITSNHDVRIQWNENRGTPIRRSILTDSELNEKFPWYSTLLEVFEHGDGNYRPRVPEYSEIEEVYGLRVNQAVNGEISPEEALAKMQSQVEEIME